MLSHVIPQCLVTDGITIKLQLTGKSHLIFKLNGRINKDLFSQSSAHCLSCFYFAVEILNKASHGRQVMGEWGRCGFPNH